MSDEFDDAQETEHSEGAGIANLRKEYEAQKKELAALKAEREQRQAAERAEQVKNLLKARGVPESAAKFYQGDDASEDAVGKWIEEHADVFKPTVEAKPDPNAEAAARISAASYGDHGGIQIEEGAGSQRVIGDPNEIARLIQTLPYPELQKLGLMPQNDPYRRPPV